MKLKSNVILITPQGRQFVQKDFVRSAKDFNQLILHCGQYEGFDENVV